MPILWRYLLISYLRVFLLSVSSFVGVLFVLRFKDIARFAALSGDGLKTGLFVLYQFPHILPIAIPISALIASFLLFQRLSKSHELTAFRASGLSFGALLTPLLCLGLGISLGNFAICAELAPYCRRESKTLFYRKGKVNPLVLLQRQPLVKMKNAYLDIKLKDEGQSAKHFVCIAYNEGSQRLQLAGIRHLELLGEELLGKGALVLSHIPGEEEGFDNTFLENQKELKTSAEILSRALKKKRSTVEPNALSFKQLQLQREEIRGKKKAELAFIEMLRRYSLSFAAFSFTLLGCAFGIQMGRSAGRKSLFLACGWTMLVFGSYLLGKSLKSQPLLATLALLAPHPLLWLASIHRLSSINRGKA